MLEIINFIVLESCDAVNICITQIFKLKNQFFVWENNDWSISQLVKRFRYQHFNFEECLSVNSIDSQISWLPHYPSNKMDWMHNSLIFNACEQPLATIYLTYYCFGFESKAKNFYLVPKEHTSFIRQIDNLPGWIVDRVDVCPQRVLQCA